MSHIKQNSTRKSRKLRILIIGSLFLCLFTLVDALTPKAHAAVKNGLTHKSNPTKILKTNLADLSGRQTVTLDWRTQSREIVFNLPAHDWYENLDVFITAIPEGHVSARTPILVSFNGGDPIALNGRGSRFDAHIRLDPSRIRTAGNILKLTYQTPSDVKCLMQQHGKWIFDLSRSKLVAKTQAKQRNMHIAEIEPRLAHPMTTPKNVAILAYGTDKYALEALLAQGIAQRTQALPKFKFNTNRADFTVLIGTNAQIRSRVKNKRLLSATSPSLFIDAGLNPKLVLSSPNEQQVIKLARAFASYHLPSRNRPDASIFDLLSGQKLSPRAILTKNPYQLADIGDVSISPQWRPKPAHLSFNVENAQASTGMLTLKIATGAGTNPNSRLNVHLNGQSLGYAKLDKKTKNVAFDISSGKLQSSGNVLKFTPNLITTDRGNDQDNICAAQDNVPSVMVSAQSKLVISHEIPVPVTDLSHLTANGSMFNQHDGETALILTARSVRDRAATLHFLGFAARQFGSQWVGAQYYASLPAQENLNKNILIIGPDVKFDPKLMASSPKSFNLAMSGKAATGQKIQKMAKLERHASHTATTSFEIAARTTGVPVRINAGGIATLFPSPYVNGKLVGIISATRPAHFRAAMHSLSTESYWNTLQGSVSRWDKKAMIMAQTSTKLPDTFFPQNQKTTTKEKFETAKTNLTTWIANIKSKKPNFANRATAKEYIDRPKLRGSIHPVPIPRVKPGHNVTPPYKSLNVASVTFPKFTNMQSSIKAKFSSGIINGKNLAQSAYSWVGNLKSNRLAILFFIFVGGFFLMAFTSPKQAGPK